MGTRLFSVPIRKNGDFHFTMQSHYTFKFWVRPTVMGRIWVYRLTFSSLSVNMNAMQKVVSTCSDFLPFNDYHSNMNMSQNWENIRRCCVKHVLNGLKVSTMTLQIPVVENG